MKRSYKISEEIFPLKRIGKKLKMLRVGKDLTLEGLIEKVGLSMPTLRKIEDGVYVSIESLLIILNFHKIHLKDFFNEIYKE